MTSSPQDQVHVRIKAAMADPHSCVDALERAFPPEFMDANPSVSWTQIVALHAQLCSWNVRARKRQDVRRMVDRYLHPQPPGAQACGPAMRRFDGSEIVALRQDRGRMRSPMHPTRNSLFNVASEADYSPYVLGRAVVSETLIGSDGPNAKTQLKSLLKNKSGIPDAYLRQELEEAEEVDMCGSPNMDLLRQGIGLEYEFKLQRELSALGIAFESEKELQQRGYAKTPDVHLPVPIGVHVTDPHTGQTAVKIIHWIDSKAMYGDAETHHSHNRPQMEAYVNRFGPGLVIYWFGLHPALLQSDIAHVLVSDCFPHPDVLLLMV